jgi:hypothetical protein
MTVEPATTTETADAHELGDPWEEHPPCTYVALLDIGALADTCSLSIL